MIEQRKKERGSQIDGGTTTENAFLGYLAIMLCCKTEVAYREVAYSESVGRISANKFRPTRQRLLAVDTLQDKGCLQWILPTGKPYPDRGCWVTSGAEVQRVAKQYDIYLELIEKSRRALGTSRSYLVGWKPPDEGWYKLNVDGSIVQNCNLGTCGSIFRNSNGTVIAGFMMKIGNVTITDTKLWVVYNGLQLVIDLGIDRVKVESDSACAAQLLQNESNPFHGSSTLIQEIKNLQSRMVNCVIHHVLRESNFTADALAKHARNLPVGIHCFDAPSPLSCPFLEC
ncbi:hypothetical protein AHAS_Ahas03G0115600 [Arachis hypogaea]